MSLGGVFYLNSCRDFSYLELYLMIKDSLLGTRDAGISKSKS